MLRILIYLLMMSIAMMPSAFAEIRAAGEPVIVAGGEGALRAVRPLWSTDGRQIAFTSPYYQGLWILDFSSGAIVQISTDPAAGFGFQWSPDSRAIVCRTAMYQGRFRLNQLKIFDLENGREQLIGEARALMPGLPSWDPGQGKILLPGQDRLEIYDSGLPVVSVDKTRPEKELLVQLGDRIAVGNTENGSFRLLDVLGGQSIINLTLSNDGSRAAFELVGGSMYAMNTDGTGIIDLGRGHRPQWGPDAEYLVYMITEDDGYRYLSSDIYTIRVDGSEKTNLSNTRTIMEMNPSWSPDGRFIAFDVMEEGAIYVMEVSR